MKRIQKLIHLWDCLVENDKKFSDQAPDEQFERLVADVRELMCKYMASADTKDTYDSSDTSEGDIEDIYSNLNTLTDVDSTLSSFPRGGTLSPVISTFSSLELSSASVVETLSQSVGADYKFSVQVVEHKSLYKFFKSSPFLIVQEEPRDLDPSFVFKELNFQTIAEHGIGLKYLGEKTIKKNTFVLSVKGRWICEEERKTLPNHRYVIQHNSYMKFLMDERFSVDNAGLCINQGATADDINCGFWFRFHKYAPRNIPQYSICVDTDNSFYIDLQFSYFQHNFMSDIDRHQPMVYVYALRDIEPGEKLYVDYGEKFWTEQ